MDLRQLSPSEMVDISQVRLPPSPMTAWIVAVAIALAAAAVLAIAVLVEPSFDPDAAGNVQTVNDRPLGDVAALPIAFDEAIEISGLGPGSEARLEASVLGVPLGVAQAPLTAGSARWEPTYLQWTTAGVVDLRVRVDDDPTARAALRAAATQQWWLTGPAVLAMFTTAFGVASFQSNIRGLRRGRYRFGARLGLALSGTIVALGAIAMTIATTRVMPSTAVLAVVIAAGAVAAPFFGEGYRRRRDRLRMTLATRRR